MSSPRLHEGLIAGHIVNLIDTSLSSDLGLKVVTIGALEFYPAIEELSLNVPAVFIKPAPNTILERITTAQTYRLTYNFRIVFVNLFHSNQEVIKLKCEKTQKIAELLIDNVDLKGLELPNANILFSTLKSIEWEPPEDNLVATLNADLTASALNFMVETTARK